jgi:predicted lipoprotein with Yx(FWY)xxD motif
MKAFATVLVLAAATLTVTACGSGGESTTTSTSGPESGAAPESSKSSESGAASEPGGGPVVSAKTLSGLGTVLVDPEGKTLYMFAPDKKSKVTCTGSCAAVWPPLKVEAGEKAEASGGVKAGLLGTDPDPEGGEVVTYAGWPLYTYVADTGPGSANGQGVNLNGGYWYVITPAGKIVK